MVNIGKCGLQLVCFLDESRLVSRIAGVLVQVDQELRGFLFVVFGALDQPFFPHLVAGMAHFGKPPVNKTEGFPVRFGNRFHDAGTMSKVGTAGDRRPRTRRAYFSRHLEFDIPASSVIGKPFHSILGGTLASATSAFVGSLPQLDAITHIIANGLSSLCSLVTLTVATVAAVRWIRAKRKR